MSVTYFIGGAPRSGKTTVIQELIKRKPMLAASSDAIRSTAKGLLFPPENPALFKTARGEFGNEEHVHNMLNKPEVALEHEIGEATETWKSVLDFLSYYHKDDVDSAVEGVAVLPEQLTRVKFDYKAVFIVNLADQTEAIMEHAVTHSNDWLSKYNEETVRAFCKFNQTWNKYIFREARKNDFKVVLIEEKNFDKSVQQAVDILLAD